MMEWNPYRDRTREVLEDDLFPVGRAVGSRRLFADQLQLPVLLHDAEVSSSDLAAARDKYGTGGRTKSNFLNYCNFWHINKPN